MHDAMKAYHESWERELDRQFLKNDRYRKRAYICSPLSGSTAEEELSNIWRARAYMLYARTMLGYMARAPHAYLPMLLCDHVAAERALALQFGLQLLEQSEVLLICGGRISRGMKGEIHHAAQLGIPIIVPRYCPYCQGSPIRRLCRWGKLHAEPPHLQTSLCTPGQAVPPLRH